VAILFPISRRVKVAKDFRKENLVISKEWTKLFTGTAGPTVAGRYGSNSPGGVPMPHSTLPGNLAPDMLLLGSTGDKIVDFLRNTQRFLEA
jgi:hypothetical protein